MKVDPSTIQVPFVMHCNVTGLPKVFTSREYIAKKLEAFNGNMQKMLNTYVCEDAKRLLREGKSIRQINIQLGGNKRPSEVNLDRLILDRRMSSENYRQGALHRRQGRRFQRSHRSAPGSVRRLTSPGRNTQSKRHAVAA